MRRSVLVAPLALTFVVIGLTGEASGHGAHRNVLPADPVPIVTESQDSASLAQSTSILSHSHNDYQQPHPLTDAMANQFNSVEADIWISKNDLLISHMGISYKGSLRQLYLEPLRKQIAAHGGSVYGDGKPVYLWLDIKDGDERLATMLQEQLSAYADILTTYQDSALGSKVLSKPISVILTGDEGNKNRYVEKFPVRYACRDSNYFKIQDPKVETSGKWLWYALEWGDFFRWNGRGKMPEREAQWLRWLVASIHAKGRRVRFWDAPETDEFWTQAVASRVDMISTDHLSRYSTFARAFLKPKQVLVKNAEF